MNFSITALILSVVMLVLSLVNTYSTYKTRDYFKYSEYLEQVKASCGKSKPLLYNLKTITCIDKAGRIREIENTIK